MRILSAAVALLVGSTALISGWGQRIRQEISEKPLVVSRKYPEDSRGETVYTNQGDSDRDLPAVPGKLVQPSLIKKVYPKYPKSMKKAKSDADVNLEGVIAQNGDFIDAKAVDAANPDAVQSALDAIEKYKFRPATLDGKPVAFLAKVTIFFRVY